jgi:adenylate cyclase
VHTGVAFVGIVGGGEERPSDFTALGDSVNVTARLASNAGAGEILVSEDALRHAGIDATGLEQRTLSLKGKTDTLSVYVLHAARSRA